jgi:dTDP-4-amino-4,6-dideoxygalactose transaminase
MIPFSPPRIDKKTIEEVTKALSSGWITTGPRTKEFEKQIAAYCHIKQVVCVNSASAGLELALRWFGVRPGDEVILPAYTYAATANVIVHCGAIPVFVDSNTEDFTIQTEAIRNAITSRTKVIMPVDIGGYPCDYDSIYDLIQTEEIHTLYSPETENQQKLNRILILSDAAHSFGAEYKGKKTGALADISVFSFHAVKNLTTAEGGAICLNLPADFDNESIYTELCIKSLHGQTKDALAKMQIGNWQYDIVEAGYKCNMTDIQAAIGLVELSRYDDDMLVKRNYIFDSYTNAFSAEEWAEVPLYHTSDRLSSYHVYMLRIKGITEQQRNAIMQAIFTKGVAVNVHFIPLPMMSYYKSKGYRIENYPNAYSSFANELSLPVYYDLSDNDIKTVIHVVKTVVREILHR